MLAALRQRPETGVADGLAFARAVGQGGAIEPLPDGGLEGPRLPGKRIAGLPYGIDLPGAWKSQVEPTQTHVGAMTKAVARSGGAISTTIFQWVPAKAGQNTAPRY